MTVSTTASEGSYVTTNISENWTIPNPSSEFSTVGNMFEKAEEIVQMIQIIRRPPIIILGTLGNVLTFLTMQRGSLKKSVYLFLYGNSGFSGYR